MLPSEKLAPQRKSASALPLAISFGSERQLGRLRAALHAEYALVGATTWQSFAVALANHIPHVVVVDVQLGGSSSAIAGDRIATVRQRCPDVPVVIYTPLSAQIAHIAFSLGPWSNSLLMLEGFDDGPDHIRAIVQRAVQAHTVGELVTPLVGALQDSGSPSSVVDAVRRLFDGPHCFANGSALARSTVLTRRHVYRCLAHAGVAPLHVIILAARVYRAHQLAQNAPATLREIANRVGFSRPHLLSLHTRSLTGLTFREWRETPHDQAAAILLTHLHPTRGAAT